MLAAGWVEGEDKQEVLWEWEWEERLESGLVKDGLEELVGAIANGVEYYKETKSDEKAYSRYATGEATERLIMTTQTR